MAVKPVPDGFHTITPYLVVLGVDKLIEFLKAAFDGEVTELLNRPDGTIMHAQVNIGDSTVMLSDENPQFGTSSPLTLQGNHAIVHLYVADADAVFNRAVEAGCEVLAPIEDAFGGDRFGKVKDPFGHVWGIATQQEVVGEKEMAQRMTAFLSDCGQGPPDEQSS